MNLPKCECGDVDVDGKVLQILDEKNYMQVMDFDENFRTMVTKEKVFKTDEFKPALDRILEEYDFKTQWEEHCRVQLKKQLEKVEKEFLKV